MSSADHLKISADIQSLSNGSFTPSPISLINGHDVSEVSKSGHGLQDLDALFNSVFYRPASATADGATGKFTLDRFTGQSDTNSLKFENGTILEINANVLINSSFAGQLPRSGQEYHERMATTNPPTNFGSPSLSPLPPLPLGPTYPTPIMKHSQNWISGYFLSGIDDSDVAVLSVTTFEATSTTQPEFIEFLVKSAAFLEMCISTEKKSLIVDVRNNGGGLVMLGYELFQLLFPGIVPYSGIRIRASSTTNVIGQAAAASNTSAVLTEGIFDVKIVRQRTSGPAYTSWQPFYGPVHQHDDLFSNLGAVSYSTPDDTPQLAETIQNITNVTTVLSQVFPSDAITLVSLPIKNCHSKDKRILLTKILS